MYIDLQYSLFVSFYCARDDWDVLGAFQRDLLYTLLYAIQENVFEARNKQWELKCTFSQQKGIF